jgi:hypothetical protein
MILKSIVYKLHIFTLQYNPLDALISRIYFGNETLHVSDSSSVHHQELFTVHSTMLNVIQACRQLSNGIRMLHPDPDVCLAFDPYLFLGAFTKLQKATISFFMSVRPSVCSSVLVNNLHLQRSRGAADRLYSN